MAEKPKVHCIQFKIVLII